MKKPAIMLAAACVAAAFAAGAAEAPKRIPLVDFSRAEDAKGVFANFAKPGSYALRHDAERGCVVYSFTNTSSHLVFPVANARLRERIQELKPEAFYVKYRAPRYEATTEFKLEAGKAIYMMIMPVAADPDFGLAIMRSKFMAWSKNNLPYVSTDITGIYLSITGSGELEIYEMGVYQESAVKELPPRDATPVPADAFAVFPEPREWKLTGGKFTLPKDCTWNAGALPDGAKEDFRRELADFHGVTLRPAPAGTPALIDFALEKELGPVKYDGFTIDATPSGIKARALEPTGLAYAADVLRELIWRAGGVEIPAFSLADWPRYRYRPWVDMTSTCYHLQKYPVGLYTDMLERFILSRRYNRIGHCMDQLFQWSSPAMPKRHNAWTPADYAAIVDFTNGRGARMMPSVPSLGHQDYFICLGKENAKRFGEDGMPGVLCTRNPEATALLMGMYDELIALCSRNQGCEPDFFLSWHDEVRWRTHEVPESNRCARCAGVPKNRLFLESVRRCRDRAASSGMREVIYSDMIAEAHNGRNRFNCAAIVDEIPRDVVLASWSSLDALSIPTFKEKGFANWKINTGVREDPTGDDDLEGMGLGVYTFNWWLSRVRNPPGHVNYGIMAAAIQGYYAWRESPRGPGDISAMARKWGDFLVRGWSRKPIRGKTREERLETEPLAAPGKAVSLVFTHSVTIDPSKAAEFLSKNNAKDALLGPEVAVFTVYYADGATERIPMTFGWNVGEAELDGRERKQLLARYLADCRRVIPDAEDRRVSYEYEWANPRPDVEIVGLEVALPDSPGAVYRLEGLAAGRGQ